MTHYICNRRIPDCMFCDIGCPHTTTDYNYAKNKGKPMTFLVEMVFRPTKELINKGPASLFEVPYVGTDE